MIVQVCCDYFLDLGSCHPVLAQLVWMFGNYYGSISEVSLMMGNGTIV